MESFGAFLDEEWDSLSKLFSGDQDSGHFSGHDLFSSEQDHGLNFETPSFVSSIMTESNVGNASFVNNHGVCYAYENVNPNFYHNFSQETCHNESNIYVGYENATSFPYPCSQITSLPCNDVCDHEPMEFQDQIFNNSTLLAQVFSDDSMEEILCLRQNLSVENSVNPSAPDAVQIKRIPSKRKLIEMPIVEEEKPVEDPKKKPRVSRDTKNKMKVQPKNKQKVVDEKSDVKGADGEDDINNKLEGNAPIASSSSCGSEEDGGAINSNWKTRAGRGAATDPQSLYARKRRERINERLKVLQNLVPNGTKVDISTMLEEAVEYVKFLQLQIKLLSSDEMWMYAPIAYNGMDMGLYSKLSQS